VHLHPRKLNHPQNVEDYLGKINYYLTIAAEILKDILFLIIAKK